MAEEDNKTALRNATTQYRQAAADLENAKRTESGIEEAQRKFDEASEKLGETMKADVMARNLGGKRRRRATKRRHRLRHRRRTTTRRRF